MRQDRAREQAGRRWRMHPKAERAEREAAQAQRRKMRKLDTLVLIGVQHDFKNHPTPLGGLLERAQHKLEDDGRTGRLIRAGLVLAERMRILVSRLLAFAGLNSVAKARDAMLRPFAVSGPRGASAA